MASEYDSLLEEPPQQSEYDALLAPEPKPEPSILQKTGRAIVDTLKSFVPQSVEEAVLAPAYHFPGTGPIVKSLANVAFDREPSEGISPISGIPVVQRIPEIMAAEKTPAGSQERFTTGAGVVADLAMIAGFKGLMKHEAAAARPKLAEVAGIAKPEITKPIEPVAVNEAQATPIVPEVAEPEMIASSAWKLQNGDVVSTGPLHGEPPEPNAQVGFTTTKGRFLDREQAGELATGLKQELRGEDFFQELDVVPSLAEHPIAKQEPVAPDLPTGTGEAVRPEQLSVEQADTYFRNEGRRGAFVMDAHKKAIKDAIDEGRTYNADAAEFHGLQPEPSPVSEAPVSTTATPLTQTETSISGNKTPVAQTTAAGKGESVLPHERPDFERGSIHINVRGNELDLTRPLSGWVLPAELSDNPNTMSTRYGRAGLTAVYVPKEFVKTSKTRPARIKEGYTPPTENVAVIPPEAVRPSGTIDWTKVFKREPTSVQEGGVSDTGSAIQKESLTPTGGIENAVQEQSPSSVLQHPQETVAETGGKGVEPGVQGEETPQTGVVGQERPVAETVPPTEPPAVTPTVPEVPQKPSKIGQSIEAKAVEAKLTQGFAETAGYDPLTIKDQAQRATDLIKQSVPNARAIIRGEAPLPEGLRGTSVITAMEEQLLRKPDARMAYELANSPLTSATSAAAQEMRLMAERVPDGIAAKFTEIKTARAEGAKLRNETPKNVVADITKEVVRQASKRPTWEQFVREIVCPV